MQLSRNSKLVRFAYWSDAPARTTLCKLFWLIILKSFIITFIVYCTSYGLLTNPVGVLKFAGFILIGFLSVIAFAFIDDRIESRKFRRSFPELYPSKPSVIREAIYGIKNKVCPIIEIK